MRSMSKVEAASPEEVLKFSRPLDSVSAIVRDHIATITFSRPPVNAVDMRAMREIHTAFSEIGKHTEVRVVIFTSAGAKPFCAGADLNEFAGQQDADFASRIDEGLIARETFSAIRACPVPVIAAVNGAAIGAGVALTSSCDIIIADRTARFGATEINVGLLGAVSHLRRLVGEYRAREMFFTGELASADELHRRGAIAQVVEPEKLQDTCRDLAVRLAGKSPIAMRLAKDSINRTEGLQVEDAYRVEQDYTARLRQFDDSREAAAAFLEKREPRWTLS
jgi:enoyl-CoA hydratase